MWEQVRKRERESAFFFQAKGEKKREASTLGYFFWCFSQKSRFLTYKEKKLAREREQDGERMYVLEFELL